MPGISPDHVLLILLDGVGLPLSRPLSESVYADFPVLLELLERRSRPLDACLGVPGPPQSATGQTAIFTGINAPARLGEHIQGFPNARLRRMVASANVFTRLLARGVSCTFANAYVRGPGAELPLMLRSVTTVATLSAFGQTRSREDLLRGEAVYHDLTRWTLPERGIEDVPRISEHRAARDLWRVARSVRFCLFEFFLTDRMAHRGTPEQRRRVLRSLDLFLGELRGQCVSRRELLLLVSDHGNIEDESRRGHTRNPVPWIAFGRGSREAHRSCRDLTDVTPFIVRVLAGL